MTSGRRDNEEAIAPPLAVRACIVLVRVQRANARAGRCGLSDSTRSRQYLIARRRRGRRTAIDAAADPPPDTLLSATTRSSRQQRHRAPPAAKPPTTARPSSQLPRHQRRVRPSFFPDQLAVRAALHHHAL